jgi:hypothetical protein
MTLNQNIISDSLHQFQKLRERISSLNEFLKAVSKEMELVKKNINEIDLAGLKGNLKQYTNSAIGAIPQPDLSDYLTRSYVYNMPQVAPIPGESVNPFRNGSLLVTKSYVDTTINNTQPNLSNYLTTNVYIPPIDFIVVEVPNPDDNKLIIKNM